MGLVLWMENGIHGVKSHKLIREIVIYSVISKLFRETYIFCNDDIMDLIQNTWYTYLMTLLYFL